MTTVDLPATRPVLRPSGARALLRILLDASSTPAQPASLPRSTPRDDCQRPDPIAA